MLQLNFNNMTISIIQAYAPTEDSSEEDILNFYNTLNKAYEFANKNIILLGDFNAKIGQPRKNEGIVMGNFGYGSRSKRGELLISHALEHKLSIVNTFFNKKVHRRWTWISPDGKTKNEIDFILTNFVKSVSNLEVLNNFQFPSDHRLVRATFMIKNKRLCRKTFKKSFKIPRTEHEVDVYLNNLTKLLNKLKDTISSERNINVQTFYDSLEAIIKTNIEPQIYPDKQRRSILSEETKKLIERRSELLKRKHKDRETKKELSYLFKTTNKKIRKDYENHRKNVIEKNLTQHRSYKRAKHELKSHKNWITALSSGNQKLNSRSDLLDCATKFY
ncbi:craniofacial development protein 2-like [Bicyclus anynana]|uniref:Craniofacial development protein 2-like n=1 Tax=Bicyclus anynana TaxID=110368 RepID=A0ABM3LP11_BICAN|nr:craniofacial development protein 2-like [Bicyclus anynana]